MRRLERKITKLPLLVRACICVKAWNKNSIANCCEIDLTFNIF